MSYRFLLNAFKTFRKVETFFLSYYSIKPILFYAFSYSFIKGDLNAYNSTIILCFLTNHTSSIVN